MARTITHRPQTWRVVVFVALSIPWITWFLVGVWLILLGRLGMKMWRIHDRWLDWLHAGCCRPSAGERALRAHEGWDNEEIEREFADWPRS